MKMFNKYLYLPLIFLSMGAACFADIESQMNITFKNETSFKDENLKLLCEISPVGLRNWFSLSKEFSGTEIFKKEGSLLSKWAEGATLLMNTRIPLEISFIFLFDKEKIPSKEVGLAGTRFIPDEKNSAMCSVWAAAPHPLAYAGVNRTYVCDHAKFSNRQVVTFDPDSNRIVKRQIILQYDDQTGLKLIIK